MKLKDILNVGDYVRVYRLNRDISAKSMYGTILYKGNVFQCDLDISDDKKSIFNDEIFRIFDDCQWNKCYIVY